MNKITYYAKKVSGYFKVDDKRGVTAIEYGLIAAVIAIVIVGGAQQLGTNVNSVFKAVAASVGDHTPAPK